VIQLAIDDGVPSRGHLHNIFNPKFASVGSYSGPHARYGQSTVLDYTGRASTFDMQAFMREPVKWTVPKGARRWSDSVRVSTKDGIATKVVTRTYTMAD